ncbi:MAG: hypothetical protein KN64_06975 [Sulfurovum sp. AS07-7]|nr:MAG: hypothetical protein KN64_06975 [Sulfurovum sp. AS07-7]
MKFLIFALLFTMSLWSEEFSLTIEKDVSKKANIGVVEDINRGANGEKMFHLFVNDLKLTGHFTPDGIYRQAPFASNAVPTQSMSREFILKYSNVYANSLDVRLMRSSDGVVIFAKKYSASSADKFPFLVHNAVSDINAFLGFGDISWIKRNILFSKYISPKKSEIWSADYTLTYAKVIVKGGLNLFPKWANTAQNAFYYTSYNDFLPTLYRVDLATASRVKIVASEGMVVCSDVSSDARRLLLTMAPKGSIDVYEYILGGALKRVTNFKGIDVNGKYLANEKSIAFVSDMLGSANIYSKSIEGTNFSKIAYYGGNNSSCDTSGDYILYSSNESGGSNIYLGATQSTYIRALTPSGYNYLPRFSNDGRVILYIKKVGSGNEIRYLNLATKQTLAYPMVQGEIQSIDW